MKKKCTIGKSCGYSCISKSKVCVIDLSTSGLSKVQKLVNKKDSQSFAPPKELNPSAPFDKEVSKVYSSLNSLKNKDVNLYNGTSNANDVNWHAGMETKAKKTGSGSFASFMEVPPDRLIHGGSKKFPEGVGIKYGKILEGEVEMLKLLGDNNLGPKLISAKISRQRELEMSGFPPKPSYIGMVAMSKIPGKTISRILEEDLPSSREKNDLRDSALRAFSKLHNLGVAHGDAASRNLVVTPKGEVKFIDLGNARRNWTHALAEAVGLLSGSTSPLISEYNDNKLTNLLKSNWKDRVVPYLKNQKVNSIMTESLESWANVPEKVAIKAIKELYHGIS